MKNTKTPTKIKFTIIEIVYEKKTNNWLIMYYHQNTNI